MMNGHSPNHSGSECDGDGELIALGGDAAAGSSSFDRTEVLRIIAQALKHYGCSESAETLVRESGIEVEAPVYVEFKEHILAGRWAEAEALADDIEPRQPSDSTSIRFLLYEQIFLEALERHDVKSALHYLRTKMTPLQHNVERLHALSALIMCTDPDELRSAAGWAGLPKSRYNLLAALQDHISTSMLTPANRLQTLLTQATELQKRDCLYHNSRSKSVSLLEDHHCSRSAIPLYTRAVLDDHEDEVWFLRFSNSGSMLAAASKDQTACIWDTASCTLKHRLEGHTDALSYLAWSPDDALLLTCGFDNDRKVCMWDTNTGECLLTIKKHTQGVTACAWLPCGTQFVTGSTDQTMRLWNLEGTLLQTWEGVRPTDLAVSSDGSQLVATCHEHKLRVYNLKTGEQRWMQESSAITSLSLTPDGQHALVNLVSKQLHLWDLKTFQVVGTFKGHQQGRYAIRSCFGGSDEVFVASGSEDHKIYLWHRQSEKLLEVIEGHSNVVNAVVWHPADACVFASASDDHTVRLWSSTPPADEDGEEHENGVAIGNAVASATNGVPRQANGFSKLLAATSSLV